MHSYSGWNEIIIKIKAVSTAVFEFSIYDYQTISELKDKITNKLNIDKIKQKLIFQGKVLENTKKIRDYRIETGDVVHWVEVEIRTNSINNSSNNINWIHRVEAGDINEFPELMNLRRLQRMIGTISELYGNLNRIRQWGNGASVDDINNQPRQLTDLDSVYNGHIEHQRNNRNNPSASTPDDDEGVFENYKPWKKNEKFDKIFSAEIITQNINDMFTMINMENRLDSSTSPNINSLFDENLENPDITFKVGQWVDLKDPQGYWIEGQIVSIRNDSWNIQYIGYPSTVKEWITKSSKRISLFRSHTMQSISTDYSSPYPNKNKVFENRETLIYSNIKQFDCLNNEILIFFDFIKTKYSAVIKQRDLNTKNNYYGRTSFFDNERWQYWQIMQLYPILDRFGRLWTDIAKHWWYSSYEFYENNIELFKNNITKNISTNWDRWNYNERNRLINEKIANFQTLANWTIINSTNSNTTGTSTSRGELLRRSNEQLLIWDQRSYGNNNRSFNNLEISRSNIMITSQGKVQRRRKQIDFTMQTEGFMGLAIDKNVEDFSFKVNTGKNEIKDRRWDGDDKKQKVIVKGNKSTIIAQDKLGSRNDKGGLYSSVPKVGMKKSTDDTAKFKVNTKTKLKIKK